jgi:hypothetical protein
VIPASSTIMSSEDSTISETESAIQMTIAQGDCQQERAEAQGDEPEVHGFHGASVIRVAQGARGFFTGFCERFNRRLKRFSPLWVGNQEYGKGTPPHTPPI